MEWILSGGVIKLSTRVPMPPSIRNMNATEARKWLRSMILASLGSRDFEENEYAMRLNYYGNWHNKNRKIKTRDLANLLSHLSDDIAEALGIDDRCWFHIAMSKRSMDMDDEHVKVDIWESAD